MKILIYTTLAILLFDAVFILARFRLSNKK